jgi:transcriptional regulator with XRE-family HTH domain
VEATQFGKHIKRLRKKAGLPLRELASKAGMSAGAISSIERQRSSPTLATMQKILQALGMDFTQFFSSQQAVDETPVFAAANMQVAEDSYRKYTFLLPQRDDIQFEIVMEAISPSEKKKSEWESHPCDVGGVLFSGNQAKLEIKDRGEWALTQGDAFYIAANLKHRLVNLSDTLVQLITVYYPPRY